MVLVVWSAVVSIAYAVLALAAPSVANVMVVAFIALLVIPATAHLFNRSGDDQPHV
jgi:hypothetical protein